VENRREGDSSLSSHHAVRRVTKSHKVLLSFTMILAIVPFLQRKSDMIGLVLLEL
jgi:hypothetical protein